MANSQVERTQIANININVESDEIESSGDSGCGGVSGILLTWQDVWVTAVSCGKNGIKPILNGLTGFACPGQVLAIMGPSGCGKSTLLDVLAGRLDPNVKGSGSILINGKKQELAYGTSGYVQQDNILTWTLTVREAVYYSAELQLPNTMSKTDKRERAEKTINEMGLKHCIDTRIGGWGTKGLSTGQKRRVSICIEILTRPKLLFLDEPTSGLDSAAAYYVMSRIVKLTKQFGMTLVASMHQPSNEVFMLLDNLCLLSLGRTIYLGPSNEAHQFFASNGIACPAFQNQADHFLRITNTDFNEDSEAGDQVKIKAQEVTDKLAESYKSTDIWKQIQKYVSDIHTQEAVIVKKKNEKHAGFFQQCLVLSERSFLNMYRDLGYYWLRLAIYIALGFGLGTVFFNLGDSHSSINARGSMLMFVSSLLTIMAIGGFPSFVEEMKVFRRERLNGHYGVAAFVISNTISSIPFLFLISVMPGAISYYLVGLHPGIERFVCFCLILLASIMLVESLMMIVTSIVPNFLMALISGAGIQGLMMLSGGFFRLPDDLPKVFWKYPMYYVAFHRYAYQGLYKNEFEGLRFRENQSGDGSDTTVDGETILKEVWQVEMGYSKWIDLAILFGMIVLYKLLFFGIIKIGERLKPMIKDFVFKKKQ